MIGAGLICSAITKNSELARWAGSYTTLVHDLAVAITHFATNNRHHDFRLHYFLVRHH